MHHASCNAPEVLLWHLPRRPTTGQPHRLKNFRVPEIFEIWRNFFMRRPRAPNPCPARKPSGSWCEASPGRDCRRVYEICCPGRFAFSDVNHLAPRRHAAPSAKPAIPDAPGFARGLFPELILTLLSPLCSCRMARAPAWRPFLADECLLRLCRAA